MLFIMLSFFFLQFHQDNEFLSLVFRSTLKTLILIKYNYASLLADEAPSYLAVSHFWCAAVKLYLSQRENSWAKGVKSDMIYLSQVHVQKLKAVLSYKGCFILPFCD